MELEEAIKTLENFKNNKLEHDKLEIRYHGGFKIGDIYKFTELNPAVETVLNHLTKQEKMIDLMVEEIHYMVNMGDWMDRKIDKLDYAEEIKLHFENQAEEAEQMRDNVGVILGLLGLLGVFIIALGFIIGAFMLHWILGLITTGITLLVFACILTKDDDENYFWED